MFAVEILIGLALLVFGRRLFWLFVGGMGFVLGVILVSMFLKGQSEWVTLAAALAAGLIGAVLARSFQQIMLVVAGFVAGGYVITTLAKLLALNLDPNAWGLFVIGGLVGAALVISLFDWALIVLSSISGSTLIVDTLQPGRQYITILFLVLLTLGIVFQAGWLSQRRPHK
jgi:hypothetical protein